MLHQTRTDWGQWEGEDTWSVLRQVLCATHLCLCVGHFSIEADVIDEYLSKNDYSKVNLDHLFEGLNV